MLVYRTLSRFNFTCYNSQYLLCRNFQNITRLAPASQHYTLDLSLLKSRDQPASGPELGPVL